MKIESLEHLCKITPVDFTKCPVAIAVKFSGPSGGGLAYQAIEHVSFHEDGDGKRLLVFHRDYVSDPK